MRGIGRGSTDPGDEVGESSAQTGLGQVAEGCSRLAYAGVTLQTAGSRTEVPAVTDPVVAEIHEFQLAGADGPLVECMLHRATVSVPDLEQEPRWPQWTEMVLALGVRSRPRTRRRG
ncbi:hypothetical protein AB0E69_33745 [Kribbella sp. NPDC026611]|uniref:hypothetical protein n=1 Tax=Kribbella sp. NPDC026611 TaxID=3154911 RepID=UPI0033CED7E3